MKRLLVALFLIAPALPTPSWSASAANDAAQAVQGQASQLGNGQTAADRLGTPLISNTQMSTLDGQKSFGARMMCPSSNAFLTLQVLPDLGSGNIVSAVFSQDTNMDGTADFNYVVPYDITGICANGLISCTTCNAALNGCTNCSYYQWAADASGKLSLASAAVTQLGGCYCINTACVVSATGGTSPTLSNIGIVLQSLGGGAAATIQAKLPQTAISNPKVDEPNMKISYYGQSTGACAGLASGAGSPTQYYDPQNASPLGTAATAEQTAQAADPDSIYTMAVNSVAKTKGGMYSASCTVTRNYAVSTQTQTVTGNGSKTNVWTASDVQLQVVSSGGSYKVQFYTPPIGGVQGDYPAWTTDKTVTLNNMTVTNVLLCGSTVWNDPSCNSQGKSSTVPRCYPANPLPLSVSGCDVIGSHHLDLFYDYTIDYKFDTESETISNGCQQYESAPLNAQCTLQGEIQYDKDGNGITVYNNFNPTGLQPMADTCQTVTTTIKTYTLCRPWWKVKRTYLCNGSQPIDLAKEKGIAKEITQSTEAGSSYTSGTLNLGYTANGVSNSATIGGLKDSSDSCEWVCKTKIPIQNTQMGVTGSISQGAASTDSILYYYRLCKPDAGGNYTVCPVEAQGETVVDPCACPDVKNQNVFGAAAAAINALGEAAKDLICSDGTKK